MAAPHGKDGYNEGAPYPEYTPMPPAGPPPYSSYPDPGPPPPPGPTVQVVQPASVVYQANVPIILHQNHMGPDPSRTRCRSCQQEMVTRVTRRATMRTHLMALLLCVFGCWPCVCVPYCMDSCLNTDHYCSNCGSFVGSYVR